MLPAEEHTAAIDAFLSVRRADRTRLRLASEADAAFLLDLRIDPSRNQNISSTSNDLAAQIAWMRAYAGRYAAGREAYFVIEADNQPVGSVRLYDYLPDKDSFCWGSWIIRPGTSPSIAYQSAILIYDLGFGPLCFKRAHFDVRNANISVWKFHEKMGARLVRKDTLDRFFEYTIPEYRYARVRLEKFSQHRTFA